MKISPRVEIGETDSPRVVWVTIDLPDVDAVCEVSSVGNIVFHFENFKIASIVPMSAIEDREVLQFHLRSAREAYAAHLAGRPWVAEPVAVQ